MAFQFTVQQWNRFNRVIYGNDIAGALYFVDADICVDFRTGCQYACFELGGLCRMKGTSRFRLIHEMTLFEKCCAAVSIGCPEV
jgi:hypothetical protein